MFPGKSYWVPLLAFFLNNPSPATAQTVGLLREVWEGIGSENLSALTSSPDFPDRPQWSRLHLQ